VTLDSSLSLNVPGLSPRSEPIDLTATEIPHPTPYLCDIDVHQEHLSRAVAHVSNVEYVKWLDRAAELHADALGYTRQRMLGDGLMWFVARHEIDYLAEVWPDDHLVLATWVRDMSRVKSWRDYVIIRHSASPGTDDVVVCRASTLWVLVDLDRRRPVRISADMVHSFQPLCTDSTRARRKTEPED
jgi:acyl-CoA thioester hydrolase